MPPFNFTIYLPFTVTLSGHSPAPDQVPPAFKTVKINSDSPLLKPTKAAVVNQWNPNAPPPPRKLFTNRLLVNLDLHLNAGKQLLDVMFSMVHSNHLLSHYYIFT